MSIPNFDNYGEQEYQASYEETEEEKNQEDAYTEAIKMATDIPVMALPELAHVKALYNEIKRLNNLILEYKMTTCRSGCHM